MPPSPPTGGHETTLVPAQSATPEAYQRAPTLMAGMTAGSQGKVRVWVSGRRWLASVNFGTFFILYMGLMRLCYGSHNWERLFGAIYLFLGCNLALFGIRRYMHPCYISTDEAGIAITTGEGAKALRWSEIRSFEDNRSGGLHNIELYLASGQVSVDLNGYSKAAREELITLIATHVKPKNQRAVWPPQPSHSPPQLPASGVDEPY